MFRPYNISKLFFLLGLIVVPATIFAQDDDVDFDDDTEFFRVRLAELSLEYMIPQNSFGDRMDRSAIGASGTLLYQTKKGSDTFAGLDFYYGQFYRTSAPFIDVVQRTRTSIYGLDLVARYYPFTNFPLVDPFIEGMVGGKYLLSATSVVLISTNQTIDFEVDSSSTTFSYGFSAGVQMNVYRDIYYLNVKGSYLRGTSGGFYALPEGIPNQDLTIADLDFKNAPIDLLRMQIGISFAF